MADPVPPTVDVSAAALDAFAGAAGAECLREFAGAALRFLGSRPWCAGVERLGLGVLLDGILGVFRASIRPARPGIDADLWVIAGDVPPAYLVTEDIRSAAEALEVYVGLLWEWVEAAHAGESLDDCVPVYTQSGGARLAPDPETLRMLASRLDGRA